MLSSRVIFLAVVVCVVVQTATGLNCYACGKKNEGCNDPFVADLAPTYTTACASKNNMCLKIMHPEDGDCWERKCGTEADCDLYDDCHFCSGELCNSSNSVVPSFLIVGVFSVLVAKLIL